MLKRVLATVVLLAILPIGVSGQIVAKSWTRILYGCDARRSCHAVKFTMEPYPVSEFNYQVGSVKWWSWYNRPGAVYRMYAIWPFNWYGIEFGTPFWTYALFDEGGEEYYADGLDWRPDSVLTVVSYGRLGGFLGDDEDATGDAVLRPVSSIPRNTFAAPEPATLLLLGTGVLGIAAAARRRKRFN